MASMFAFEGKHDDDRAEAAEDGGDDEFEELPITHGERITYRRCRFQAHAAPVHSVDDVEFVMESLLSLRPWDTSRFRPFAYRISAADAARSLALPGAGSDDEDGKRGGDEGPDLAREGCGDGGDPGAGVKMLELLEKWDVQNVVLLCTRWDDGMPGRLGNARYKVILDRCKAVLEQCYLEALEAEEAARKEQAGDDGAAAFGPGGVRLPTRPGTGGTSVMGVDFVALRDGTVAKAARPRLVDADSIPWPEGHDHTRLENGYVMGEKKERVQHFSEDPRPEMGTRALDAPPLEMDYDLAVHLEAAEESSLSILGPLPMPELTRDALGELKRLVRPPPSVYRVCALAAVLLGWDGLQHPSDASWATCRDMLGIDQFPLHCANIRLSELHPAIVAAVAVALHEPGLSVSKMRVTSVGGTAILDWVRHVVHRYAIIMRAINPAMAPTLPADMRRRKMVLVSTKGDRRFVGGADTAPVIPAAEARMDDDLEFHGIAPPVHEVRIPAHHAALLEDAKRRERRKRREAQAGGIARGGGGRGRGAHGGTARVRGRRSLSPIDLADYVNASGGLGLTGGAVPTFERESGENLHDLADKLVGNRYKKPTGPSRKKLERLERRDARDEELEERRRRVAESESRKAMADRLDTRLAAKAKGARAKAGRPSATRESATSTAAAAGGQYPGSPSRTAATVSLLLDEGAAGAFAAGPASGDERASSAESGEVRPMSRPGFGERRGRRRA